MSAVTTLSAGGTLTKEQSSKGYHQLKHKHAPRTLALVLAFFLLADQSTRPAAIMKPEGFREDAPTAISDYPGVQECVVGVWWACAMLPGREAP